MGLSIKKAGVAIDKDKFYLVNLNEDPSLSDMLIYYLKLESTIVGSGGKDVPSPDILLQGIGIHPQHARIDLQDGQMMVTPCEAKARVCVNGKVVTGKTRLRHASRVLFGSQHLFRVVCPKLEGDPDEAPDWSFAQQELAISGKTEDEYERDKQRALDEQRRMFESRLLSSEQSLDLSPEEQQRLHEQVVTAARRLREANDLCQEMDIPVSFKTVMRLSKQALIEPALKGLQAREMAVMMSHEKQKLRRYRSLPAFQAYLEKMQAAYQARLDGEAILPPYLFSGSKDLIGVANVFLDNLQHGVTTCLEATVVTQEGRTSGRLVIELAVEPSLATASSGSETPRAHASTGHHQPLREGDTLRFVLRIVEALDLPTSLAQKVHVLYHFPYDSEQQFYVAQDDEVDHSSGQARVVFCPQDEKVFSVPVTAALLANLRDRPLSFEVYGHSAHNDQQEPFVTDPRIASPVVEPRQQEHAALAQRWAKHMTRLKYEVTVLETDDQGSFSPTYAVAHSGAVGGRLLRLREGASRRIAVRIQHDDGARLGMTGIKQVLVGDIATVSKPFRPVDSFRDEDLELVKRRFDDVLRQRKEEMEQEMQELAARGKLSVEDKERQQRLAGDMTGLLQEKDAMFNPAPDSGLPGCAITKKPTDGHDGYEGRPLFVYVAVAQDSGNDEALSSATSSNEGYVDLRLVEHNLDRTGGKLEAQYSWDAAAHHKARSLTTATGKNDRVYFSVRAIVGLEDSNEDLVITKVMSCHVVERSKSFKPNWFQRVGSDFVENAVCGLNVTVISGIPVYQGKDDDEEVEEAIHQRFERHVANMHAVMKSDKAKHQLALQAETSNSARRGTLSKTSRRSTLSPVAVAVGGATNMPHMETQLLILQQRVRQAHELGDHAYVEHLQSKAEELGRVLAAADAEWVKISPGRNRPTPRSGLARVMSSPNTQPGLAPRAASLPANNSSPLLLRRKEEPPASALKPKPVRSRHSSVSSDTIPTPAEVVANLTDSLQEAAVEPVVTTAIPAASQPNKAALADAVRSDTSPAASPTRAVATAQVVEPQAKLEQSDAPVSSDLSNNRTPDSLREFMLNEYLVEEQQVLEAVQEEEQAQAQAAAHALEDDLSSKPDEQKETDKSAMEPQPKQNDEVPTRKRRVLPVPPGQSQGIDDAQPDRAVPANGSSAGTKDSASDKKVPDAAASGAGQPSSTQRDQANVDSTISQLESDPPQAAAADASASPTLSAVSAVETETSSVGVSPVPHDDGNHDDNDDSDDDGDTSDISRTSSAASSSHSSAHAAKSKGKKRTSKWAKVTELPPAPANVGDAVMVVHGKAKRMGTLRFYGFVEFGPGPWAGVEYTKPQGKHNGSKDGKVYFTCQDGHGSFVRPDAISRVKKNQQEMSLRTN
eukprot:TRINITY_DN12479_c1_g1_i1.p1 TRINITY_DN12479_c1_g1~~TRINITY_DN12479_c1_g1_i1.p1  ORF type:complete len:1393 (+),score=432.09 TRINITY_DN12479_c1_g1_i1:2-4180(+)